jgi:hypothetical protein
MFHSVLPTLMFNVPSVARKTAIDVERVLGTPSQTIGSSEQQSHPRLSYQSGRVEITFVDGLASRIVLHSPSDLPFHQRALAKLGLPVRKPTLKERGRRMRWTNIAGVHEVTFEASPGGGVRSVTIRIAAHTA